MNLGPCRKYVNLVLQGTKYLVGFAYNLWYTSGRRRNLVFLLLPYFLFLKSVSLQFGTRYYCKLLSTHKRHAPQAARSVRSFGIQGGTDVQKRRKPRRAVHIFDYDYTIFSLYV